MLTVIVRGGMVLSVTGDEPEEIGTAVRVVDYDHDGDGDHEYVLDKNGNKIPASIWFEMVEAIDITFPEPDVMED